MLQEALALDSVRVECIVTLSGSSDTVMYEPVALEEWEALGPPVYAVDRLEQIEILLRELRPDFLFVCGWRHLISPELLDIAVRGTIGFHPTPLPKGRGPAPIINTLLSGWDESAVTMFYLSDGLDNGDIIGQEFFSIGPDDYAADVQSKVVECGRKLVREMLPRLVQGTAPRLKQDEKQATVFPKPRLADNRLDPRSDTVAMMHRKIRALSHPYRGAYIEKDGERLVIWTADLIRQ